MHAVYKKPYFYYKLLNNLYQYYKLGENLYQVVQVMYAASECAMIMSLYDKTIITTVSSYTEKKSITHLLPSVLLLVFHTRNNTDSNKLMIFSGIASHYGDITNQSVQVKYESCVEPI